MFKTLIAGLALACLLLAALGALPILVTIAALVGLLLLIWLAVPPARRLVIYGASLLVAVSLAGCLSGCAGLTAFNSALVPQLKPVDAKIHTDVSCGDMAAQVLGVTAGTNTLSAAQAVAIVQFCERRDATQTLTLDPQGARKVLDGIVNRPAGLAAAVTPKP